MVEIRIWVKTMRVIRYSGCVSELDCIALHYIALRGMYQIGKEGGNNMEPVSDMLRSAPPMEGNVISTLEYYRYGNIISGRYYSLMDSYYDLLTSRNYFTRRYSFFRRCTHSTHYDRIKQFRN